ncbi:MAG: UDP-glucose 4-epimerase family protein [Methylobacter sp.]
MEPTHLFLTGATGFVGSALTADLVSLGYSIVAGVRKPVVSLPSEVRQQVVGDLSADTDWRTALIGISVVVHLAARVHVMNDKSSDPLEAFQQMNVDATLNLARQAAQSGVKRFVFISSVKVNGEETTGKPFTAFDEPAPLDPYGQSKLEAEIELRELSHVTGLEVVIIRPPLVYGPGVRANFLRLMQFVKMGIPLPLGIIHNRRSMVALDNLIDLLITCTHHPAAAGQTFMVSDDNDVSTSELICMIAAAMGKRPLLLPVSAGIITGIAALLGRSAVANRILGSLQVDITQTKSILGWKPVVTMQESLNKTVAHFLSHK